MDSLRITLKTERLLLRPWCRADLSAMADWPPFTAPLDQVWNWPQRLSLLGSLDTFFAIHDADPQRRAWTILNSGAVIGLLQLKEIHPSEGDAIMGIAFGHPWVGKGYGREALTAFLEAYFERFNFTTLRLEVALVNRRAYHLYETLMFQETRRFWRDAGTAEENRFLDEPAYAGLRSYFRWANGGVYQLYAEMKLSADRWRRQADR
jgi:RimJ/RimL family protein N-acetyltransferase